MLVVQKWQKNFFLKKFSSRYIYRDVKWNLFKPAEKSLPHERIFSCQSPQKIENLKNFLENIFHRTVPMDT